MRAAAPTARLFLALWPGPATLRALLAWRDRWRWPATAALVPAERLHLTLHFLGQVPLDRLPALAPALAVRCERFDLRLGAVEMWPRGLAVLCPEPRNDALAGLHRRLGDAVHALRLPLEDRPFRAHLSLARSAAGAQPPAAPLALRWPVRGYALVRSQSGYRTLARYGTAA